MREADEVAGGRVPGAVHIPMNDIPARIAELPAATAPFFVICAVGGRSRQVVDHLRAAGPARHQRRRRHRRLGAARLAARELTRAPLAVRASGAATAGRRLVDRWASQRREEGDVRGDVERQQASSPVPTSSEPADSGTTKSSSSSARSVQVGEPTLAGGELLGPRRQAGDAAHSGRTHAERQDGQAEQQVELGEVEAAAEQVVVVGTRLARVLEPVEPVLEGVAGVAAADASSPARVAVRRRGRGM